jgi:hypothetical protein
MTHSSRVRVLFAISLLLGCHGDRAVSNEADAVTFAESSRIAGPVATQPPPDAPSGPFYEPDPEGHPVAILRDDAPNMRYAAMDSPACLNELGKRNIPCVRASPLGDVVTPVRLKGPLHGISIHTSLAPSERDKSPMEVFDCRLVLALDDFSGLLATHDVVEVITFGAYRARNQNGCTAKYAGLQHCGGLALDIASFKKRDGTTLVVDKDFNGKIGWSTCAGGSPKPSTPGALELWSYVCDSASRAIFNVVLTPNHNLEHHNHFHVEVTPDAEWMLIK